MAVTIPVERAKLISKADKFFKVKFWQVKRAEFGCEDETQIDTMIRVLTAVKDATTVGADTITIEGQEGAFVAFVLDTIAPVIDAVQEE